jgi:hypothetical protein
MLSLVRLGEQWREIEGGLPSGRSEARLALSVDPAQRDRAAALLGPLNPGRAGSALVFSSRRAGGPSSPEGIRRLLRRLDREGISGTLELRGVAEAEAAPATDEEVRPTLVDVWDRALASLPPDWSDLLCEVELRSSGQLDRAALLMSPLNPARPAGEPERWALRFRCARRFGYGASPGMARRCFARCDAEDIRGTAGILWALSDTHPVGTQGPVWYVGGRTL